MRQPYRTGVNVWEHGQAGCGSGLTQAFPDGQTEGRVWCRVEGVEALNVLTDCDGLSVRLRVSVLAQFIFLSI